MRVGITRPPPSKQQYVRSPISPYFSGRPPVYMTPIPDSCDVRGGGAIEGEGRVKKVRSQSLGKILDKDKGKTQ